MRHENTVTWVFLGLVAFAIHASALNGFWRYDDGMHLEFAATYSPWQYYFQPSVTLLQSYANVTPYNVLFYDINLALFGMAPRWHYAHLITVLAATAFATYRLLRFWHSPLPALLAALLFLAGLPTMTIAQQLMTGHYATGLLFTVLSLICFTHGVSQKRSGLVLLGSVFYLLATTCKEVYVPLVLLLPVLPVERLADRLKAAIPYAVVAIFYTAWRYAVLGELTGGYSALPGALDERLLQLARIPLLLSGWVEGSDIRAFLLNRHGLVLMAGVFALALAVAAARGKRIAWPLVCVSLALVVAPVFPLTAGSLGLHAPDRYLFMPWWACSILLATLVGHLKAAGFERLLKPILSLGLVALMLDAQFTEHQRVAPQFAMEDTLYRTVLRADGKTALLPPENRENYKKLLSGARKAAAHFAAGPATPASIIAGKAALCEYTQQGNTIVEYDETCGCMKDVTQQLAGSLSKLLTFQDKAAPGVALQVHLSFRERKLQWRLGPFADGDYSVVFGNAVDKIPAVGEMTWNRKEPLQFQIRHDSRDGKQALSPVLEFDISRQTEFNWEGLSTVEPLACEPPSKMLTALRQ